jgi:hypothetical protein
MKTATLLGVCFVTAICAVAATPTATAHHCGQPTDGGYATCLEQLPPEPGLGQIILDCAGFGIEAPLCVAAHLQGNVYP